MDSSSDGKWAVPSLCRKTLRLEAKALSSSSSKWRLSQAANLSQNRVSIVRQWEMFIGKYPGMTVLSR